MVLKENTNKHNPNWSQIPDHPYRILKENHGQNFTSIVFFFVFCLFFLHVFLKFIETESFIKFYGVFNIYLKVMKLRSLERLDVSDVIPVNIYNMLCSAAHDVLQRSLFDLRI